jgi:hypothetical protein
MHQIDSKMRHALSMHKTCIDPPANFSLSQQLAGLQALSQCVIADPPVIAYPRDPLQQVGAGRVKRQPNGVDIQMLRKDRSEIEKKRSMTELVFNYKCDTHARFSLSLSPIRGPGSLRPASETDSLIIAGERFLITPLAATC